MTQGTIARTLAVLLTCGSVASSQTPSQQDYKESRKQYAAGEDRMRAEDFEGAVKRFRASTELDPTFILAHYSLGQALMALKRYPDAVAAYEACKEAIQRENSLDQRQLAEQDRRRRDSINELKEALESVRRSQQAKPGSVSPGVDIAIEQRIRLLEQANLRGADRRTPVPAELWLGLGSAHFRLGHTAEAQSAYEAAIEADAKLGAAHNNLAVIYMLTGRFDDARHHVELAEASGFVVSPQFKQDLEARAAAARP